MNESVYTDNMCDIPTDNSKNILEKLYQLQFDKESLKTENMKLQNQLDAAEETIKDCSQRLAYLGQEVENFTKAAEERNEILEMLEEKQNQLTILEKQHNEQLFRNTHLESALQQARESHSCLIEKIQRLETSMCEKNQQLSELVDVIHEYEKVIKERQTVIMNKTHEVDRLANECNELSSRIKDLEEQYEYVLRDSSNSNVFESLKVENSKYCAENDLENYSPNDAKSSNSISNIRTPRIRTHSPAISIHQKSLADELIEVDSEMGEKIIVHEVNVEPVYSSAYTQTDSWNLESEIKEKSKFNHKLIYTLKILKNMLQESRREGQKVQPPKSSGRQKFPSVGTAEEYRQNPPKFEVDAAELVQRCLQLVSNDTYAEDVHHPLMYVIPYEDEDLKPAEKAFEVRNASLVTSNSQPSLFQYCDSKRQLQFCKKLSNSMPLETCKEENDKFTNLKTKKVNGGNRFLWKNVGCQTDFKIPEQNKNYCNMGTNSAIRLAFSTLPSYYCALCLKRKMSNLVSENSVDWEMHELKQLCADLRMTLREIDQLTPALENAYVENVFDKETNFLIKENYCKVENNAQQSILVAELSITFEHIFHLVREVTSATMIGQLQEYQKVELLRLLVLMDERLISTVAKLKYYRNTEGAMCDVECKTNCRNSNFSPESKNEVLQLEPSNTADFVNLNNFKVESCGYRNIYDFRSLLDEMRPKVKFVSTTLYGVFKTTDWKTFCCFKPRRLHEKILKTPNTLLSNVKINLLPVTKLRIRTTSFWVVLTLGIFVAFLISLLFLAKARDKPSVNSITEWNPSHVQHLHQSWLTRVFISVTSWNLDANPTLRHPSGAPPI